MRIIKVPRINALGLKGPEKSPNIVLKELKKIYSDFDNLDLEEIHVDNGNVQEAEDLIYKNAKEEFEKGKVFFIGGDHSISYPLVNAFGDVNGFDKSFLIVFDAHADCMPAMKEPTHEEWLRAVVEKGFKPENVVLIGVRKIEPEEKDFLEENKIKCFQDVSKNLEEVVDYIAERTKGKSIYVSVDIDALEPCFAGAVNYPEVNGLNEEDFFYLLKKIFLLNVKAVDLVEIVFEKDEKDNFNTSKLGAKIVKEFLEISG